MPYDGSLPAQSVSTWKAQTGKKKPLYLCAPCEFLKQMCRPGLILIKSCSFDKRINKPSHVFLLLDLCFVLAVLVISTYYMCKGSRGFSYLNYPQINEVRKSNHMTTDTVGRARPQGPCNTLFSSVRVCGLSRHYNSPVVQCVFLMTSLVVWLQLVYGYRPPAGHLHRF